MKTKSKDNFTQHQLTVLNSAIKLDSKTKQKFLKIPTDALSRIILDMAFHQITRYIDIHAFFISNAFFQLSLSLTFS